MWPFKRKVSVHKNFVEIAEAMAEIDIPEDYRQSGQQYRDFRAVLINANANEVQARRVLLSICNWGNFMNSPYVEDDPYATHIALGAQQLCQRIMITLNAIPKTAEEED